jgi:pyridoxal phosphate enzyme (YggS family)
LKQNLAAVQARIAAAARRAGRSASDVTLVGVTKYVDVATACALFDAGCLDLGESRPQELWEKAAACNRPGVRWHLIGHLQRNKVRRTLPLVTMLHSVDSLRLLAEVERESAALHQRTRVLLEVNISGDATKHGFRPEETGEAMRAAARCDHLELRGLMAMASREGDVSAARDDFRRLRELRDRLRADAGPTMLLDELSMGMSGDFEVAVEEGATIVRVGSLLFEGIAHDPT